LAGRGVWKCVGKEALSLHLPSHLLLFRLRLRCCSGCLCACRVDGRTQAVEGDTKQNRLVSYPLILVNILCYGITKASTNALGCSSAAQSSRSVDFPVLSATRHHSRPVRARAGAAAGPHFNSWLKWRRIPTRGYPTPRMPTMRPSREHATVIPQPPRDCTPSETHGTTWGEQRRMNGNVAWIRIDASPRMAETP
jgi:hypothetical protein